MLATMLATISGCRRAPSPVQTSRLQAVDYGSLPGARSSQHLELQREIARLEKRHATPIQLELVQAASYQSFSGHDDTASGPPYTPRWAEVLEEEDWSKLHKRIERLFPDGTDRWISLRSSAAQDFAEKHDASRRAIRQIMIEESSPPRVRHSEGLLADVSFLDKAQVYLCWEQIHAVRLTLDQQRADVVPTLAATFEMIGRMAHTDHLVPRLAAAQWRRSSWELVQQLIGSGQFRRPDYEGLQGIAAAQLAQWPRDAQAWTADRAQALHTYEVIRAGYLTSILSRDEIRHFRDVDIMPRLQTAAERIDGDQYYYLQTMREFIRNCDLPYAQRRQQLQAMYAEQKRLQAEPEYPAIAVHLFLANLEPAQRQLALDRALCEAWQLGISVALDPDGRQERVNSMTGEPFVVSHDAAAISIWGATENTGRPLVIPHLPSGNAKRVFEPSGRTRQR